MKAIDHPNCVMLYDVYGKLTPNPKVVNGAENSNPNDEYSAETPNTNDVYGADAPKSMLYDVYDKSPPMEFSSGNPFGQL